MLILENRMTTKKGGRYKEKKKAQKLFLIQLSKDKHFKILWGTPFGMFIYLYVAF